MAPAPSASFEEIYLQYRESVRRTLYWMVGASAVDDLTQDVFLKVFRRLQGFRGQSKVGTWVYRITVNTAYDYLRKHRALAPLSDAQPAVARNVPLGMALEQAVLALPPKQRSVFVLFYREQLLETEISQHLGIALGTVKSRLHTARGSVQEALRARGLEKEGRTKHG